MNLHWIDWSIVVVMLAVVVGSALATRRYTRSVSDFLAANRSAGRYLLCVAGGASSLGAISIVALFEMYYAAGFTALWWSMMMFPVSLLIALSGWVTYRYRETRAMTLAQFFEERYSRKFRIFAGILAWLSGIINFGIFPAVAARFFIYFCGFPQTVPYLHISTYALTMIVLISMGLFFVFLGGQVTLMITDFIQGVFTNIVFLVLLGVIFWMFDWSGIIHALKVSAPANQSMINPFHGSGIKGFNFFFFIIGAVGAFYSARAWQGSQAYNCSAKSAHEAKMASILGEWRGLVLTMVIMLLPIGAFVVMHGHAYPEAAGKVNAILARIPNDTIRGQMTVPLALAHSLPVGAVGLLCALMVMAFISTNATYLHSWGSIFVQDVLLPLRGRQLTTRQHIWALRASIVFVGVFIFLFSLYFKQTDKILMFFAITGAIYLGGAGSVIIGGLYWKRGSASGAWAAFLVGSTVAVGGIIAREEWVKHLYPFLAAHAPGFLQGFGATLTSISTAIPGINWKLSPLEFPFNGQWTYFFAIVLAVCSYVSCSLFEWLVLRRPAANMDRLLHRGAYAIEADHSGVAAAPPTGWRALLPSAEFTKGDKAIYLGILICTFSWIVVFIFGTIWNLTHDVGDGSWVTFWAFKVGVTIAIGLFTIVWFLIGGIFDLKDLFRILGSDQRDFSDTGLVREPGRQSPEELVEAAAEVGLLPPDALQETPGR
jgi:SSS family solute:Na+ symporter